jgi:hypothetical protein
MKYPIFLYLYISSKINILFFNNRIPIHIILIVAMFFIKNIQSNVIFCILLTTLKLNIRRIIHPTTVPITAPDNPRLNIFMHIIIDMTVISNPRTNIFDLFFTFPVPANIQKFIVNKMLMIKKGLEYLSNSHEWINFCPKSTVVISGHRTKNIPPIVIENIEKYL